MTRARALITGSTAIALCLLLGVAVSRLGSFGRGVDARWMDAVLGYRSPVLTGLAVILDRVGGGSIGAVLLPLVGVVLLLSLRRPWGSLYFLAASVTSAAGVQVLKHVFGRARPLEIIVQADYGSYPSGHAANAATLAIVAAVLTRRAWVAALGALWTVVMAMSRTYLGAHWLSDVVGGVLVGAGIALLVWVLVSPALAREELRRRRTERTEVC